MRVVGNEKQQSSIDRKYATHLHQLTDEIFDIAYYVKDWTWEDLARKAGLAIQTVHKLGNRETKFPQHRTIWKLAKAVGVEYKIIMPSDFAAKMPRKIRKAG